MDNGNGGQKQRAKKQKAKHDQNKHDNDQESTKKRTQRRSNNIEAMETKETQTGMIQTTNQNLS